jgi:hypothetical protein
LKKTNVFMVTRRSITERFETQVRQAGVVTGLLRPVPEGKVLYDQLQAAERALRQQKEQWNDAVSNVGGARDALAGKAGILSSVTDAAVIVIEAGTRSEARSVLTSDAGDLAAMAGQLAELVKPVPPVGPIMSTWMMELRAAYLEAETTLAEAMAAFDALTSLVNAALLQVTLLVAQGGALLKARGVTLPKKPHGKNPAPAPAPAPARLPEGLVQPSPSLVLVPVAS